MVDLKFCFSTQLPQAAGVAYSLKMDKKDACVVTYVGDGASSEVTNSPHNHIPRCFNNSF